MPIELLMPVDILVLPLGVLLVLTAGGSSSAELCNGQCAWIFDRPTFIRCGRGVWLVAGPKDGVIFHR